MSDTISYRSAPTSRSRRARCDCRRGRRFAARAGPAAGFIARKARHGRRQAICVVTTGVRRVKIAMASGCPSQREFKRAHALLTAAAR